MSGLNLRDGGDEITGVGLGYSVAIAADGSIREVSDNDIARAKSAQDFMIERGARLEDLPSDLGFLLDFHDWMVSNFHPRDGKSIHSDYGLRCAGADLVPFSPGYWAARTVDGLKKFTQVEVAKALHAHLELGADSTGDIEDLLVDRVA